MLSSPPPPPAEEEKKTQTLSPSAFRLNGWNPRPDVLMRTTSPAMLALATQNLYFGSAKKYWRRCVHTIEIPMREVVPFKCIPSTAGACEKLARNMKTLARELHYTSHSALNGTQLDRQPPTTFSFSMLNRETMALMKHPLHLDMEAMLFSDTPWQLPSTSILPLLLGAWWVDQFRSDALRSWTRTICSRIDERMSPTTQEQDQVQQSRMALACLHAIETSMSEVDTLSMAALQAYWPSSQVNAPSEDMFHFTQIETQEWFLHFRNMMQKADGEFEDTLLMTGLFLFPQLREMSLFAQPSGDAAAWTLWLLRCQRGAKGHMSTTGSWADTQPESSFQTPTNMLAFEKAHGSTLRQLGVESMCLMHLMPASSRPPHFQFQVLLTDLQGWVEGLLVPALHLLAQQDYSLPSTSTWMWIALLVYEYDPDRFAASLKPLLVPWFGRGICKSPHIPKPSTIANLLISLWTKAFYVYRSTLVQERDAVTSPNTDEN